MILAATGLSANFTAMEILVTLVAMQILAIVAAMELEISVVMLARFALIYQYITEIVHFAELKPNRNLESVKSRVQLLHLHLLYSHGASHCL